MRLHGAMDPEPIEDELVRVVGPAHALGAPDRRADYEVDWTGQFRGQARMVVRPGDTAEVSACVTACARRRVPLVAQGGNTGLVGGSVPDASGTAVVLSTRRLTDIGPLDPVTAQVTVGAGVTLQSLQEHLRNDRLELGIDLAARGSATVGGMAATNAGGIHVIKHGTMRRRIAGLEAVLGNGQVVSHLAGLDKDNTGYDVASLLCGSEGTLGIITAVRLRLVPIAPERVTALIGWAGMRPMIDGLARLRRAVPGLEAAEYMVRPGVELVLDRYQLPDPFRTPHPAYLLIEVGAEQDPSANVATAVDALEGVRDVAVAFGQARERLWALRELHTEALAAVGPPRKYDVSVPPAAIADFLDEVVADLVAERATCHHFGHLADGNVHLNVLGLGGRPDPELDEIDGRVLRLVARHGGSISAEHGIGRAKRRWLGLSRSPAEIGAFRAIKAGLDPAGIMNPGVLLPD